MKTITADQLKFKKQLSMIEQMTLKDFLHKWVYSRKQRLAAYFEVKYTEYVFAKMENTVEETDLVNSDERFRYITLTTDNQIVMGFLDSNSELEHRIISMEEI
ncbi:hypothetical protein [Peribacillus deserti]|uniref:Uncharacterized protein n=1 Tax=Peribacillus deserti TaxID=673318 RepID=A0A2N5LZS6_9BACI|nr:hypothetical protein [Peribacillus deserti]PLT27626.1 hypothetical protein CUU66_22875 [Peribacillus deserti]